MSSISTISPAFQLIAREMQKISYNDTFSGLIGHLFNQTVSNSSWTPTQRALPITLTPIKETYPKLEENAAIADNWPPSYRLLSKSLVVDAFRGKSTEEYALSMNTLFWENSSPSLIRSSQPQITPLPDGKLPKTLEKIKTPSSTYEKLRTFDLDPTLIAASKKLERILEKNPELKQQLYDYVNDRVKIAKEVESLLLASCGGLFAGALAWAAYACLNKRR